jgi:hypothetical protein
MCKLPASILLLTLEAGTAIAGNIPDAGVPLGSSMFSFTSGNVKVSEVVCTGCTEMVGMLFAAGAE